MLKRTYSGHRHFIFWIIYIGYGILYQNVVYANDNNPLYAEALRHISFIVIFYGTYLSTNLFLKNNKQLNYKTLTYFFVALFVFCIIIFIKDYFIFDDKKISWPNFFVQIPEVFLVNIFAIFFSFIEFTEKLNNEILTTLHLKNERELLLNQSKKNKEYLIRSLDKIITESESKEMEADLKEFRQLVNFMINSTHKALIPISLEIENLKKYLHFYHLRFREVEKFKLNIVGEIIDWQIPHKSILTLIENVINHGDLSEPVTINITFEPESLKINIRNKIKPHPIKIPSTHIGLQNLEDRFRLHLDERYRFETGVGIDGWFEVGVRVW